MSGARDRRSQSMLGSVLVLLTITAFGAAARSPELAVPTATFRGPGGEIHHSGPRIARPPAVVPLGHWSYPLLSRFVTRGIIDLDLTTLPVSRREVLDALAALDPALIGSRLSRAIGDEGGRDETRPGGAVRPDGDGDGRRTAPTHRLSARNDGFSNGSSSSSTAPWLTRLRRTSAMETHRLGSGLR